MWITIKRVLDKDIKSTTVSNIEIDGKMFTKQRNVLEMLNNYFVSVGPKHADSVACFASLKVQNKHGQYTQKFRLRLINLNN